MSAMTLRSKMAALMRKSYLPMHTIPYIRIKT